MVLYSSQITSTMKYLDRIIPIDTKFKINSSSVHLKRKGTLGDQEVGNEEIR